MKLTIHNAKSDTEFRRAIQLERNRRECVLYVSRRRAAVLFKMCKAMYHADKEAAAAVFPPFELTKNLRIPVIRSKMNRVIRGAA